MAYRLQEQADLSRTGSPRPNPGRAGMAVNPDWAAIPAQPKFALSGS
jgi:hypothetical protein